MKSLTEKLGIDFPQRLNALYQKLGYTPSELNRKIQNHELSHAEGKRVFDAMVQEFCTKEGANGERVFDEETFNQIIAFDQQTQKNQQANKDQPVKRLRITEKIINERGLDHQHTNN